MWAMSEIACLTIRSDNHRGSVRGRTVRECGDSQGSVASVREVWRQSGRYKDCQRGVATVREVCPLSERCSDCQGGVVTVREV